MAVGQTHPDSSSSPTSSSPSFEFVSLLSHRLCRWRRHLHAGLILVLLPLHEGALTAEASREEFSSHLDNSTARAADGGEEVIRTDAAHFQIECFPHPRAGVGQDAANLHAVEPGDEKEASVHAGLLRCGDGLAVRETWAAARIAAAARAARKQERVSEFSGHLAVLSTSMTLRCASDVRPPEAGADRTKSAASLRVTQPAHGLIRRPVAVPGCLLPPPDFDRRNRCDAMRRVAP